MDPMLAHIQPYAQPWPQNIQTQEQPQSQSQMNSYGTTVGSGEFYTQPHILPSFPDMEMQLQGPSHVSHHDQVLNHTGSQSYTQPETHSSPHNPQMQSQEFSQVQPQSQYQMTGTPAMDYGQFYTQAHTWPSQQPQTQIQGFSQPQSEMTSFGPVIGSGEFDIQTHTQPSPQNPQMQQQGPPQTLLQHQSQTPVNISQQSSPRQSQQSYPQAPPQTNSSVNFASSSPTDLAQPFMQLQPQVQLVFGDPTPLIKYCSLPLHEIGQVLGKIPPWIDELPGNVEISQEDLKIIPILAKHYPSFYFILEVYTRDIKVQDLVTKDMPSYMKSELLSFMGPNPNLHRASK